jgi:hypothetical protein
MLPGQPQRVLQIDTISQKQGSSVFSGDGLYVCDDIPAEASDKAKRVNDFLEGELKIK